MGPPTIRPKPSSDRWRPFSYAGGARALWIFAAAAGPFPPAKDIPAGHDRPFLEPVETAAGANIVTSALQKRDEHD
jgi:hypothetical protein